MRAAPVMRGLQYRAGTAATDELALQGSKCDWAHCWYQMLTAGTAGTRSSTPSYGYCYCCMVQNIPEHPNGSQHGSWGTRVIELTLFTTPPFIFGEDGSAVQQVH
jgi:hypothetical protein